MERLTKRLHDGKVVTDCDSCEQKKDKQCTFSECRASLIKRLAAYEDIAEPCGGLDRLRELAEADKDGRCVVLPCKVGDTVWRIVRDGEPHITRDEVRDMYFADDMTPCVELVGGRVTFTEKFGKTVFLGREEAELAMEGKA